MICILFFFHSNDDDSQTNFEHIDCMFTCVVFNAIKGKLTYEKKYVQIQSIDFFFFLSMSTRSHDYKRSNSVKVVIVCLGVCVCVSVCAMLCLYLYFIYGLYECVFIHSIRYSSIRRNNRRTVSIFFYFRKPHYIETQKKTNWKKMFAILFEKWYNIYFYKLIFELTHWLCVRFNCLGSFAISIWLAIAHVAWRGMTWIELNWIGMYGVKVAWLNLYKSTKLMLAFIKCC